MTAAVIAHLWQSTLFVALAALLALAFRFNRAHVRYLVWFAASVKFLVPFSTLVVLGHQLGWRTVATRQVTLFLVERTDQVLPASGPLLRTAVFSTPAAFPQEPSTIWTITLAVWAVGVAAMLLVWFLRWRKVATLVRDSSEVVDGPELTMLRRLERSAGLGTRLAVVSTHTSVEPGVFGIWHPVLLWPHRIGTHLDDEHIEAILVHELTHVQRKDNLTAAVHALVQAIFWFHPVVWWVGRRLVDERERACDEHVIRSGSEPYVYAESILKTCQFAVELPHVCVAGVTGSDLKKRIANIMRPKAGASLTRSKQTLLAVTACLTLAGPVVLGALTAPAPRRQATPQAPARFDVVSVKVNKSGDGGVTMQALPGRIAVTNAPLMLLIRNAYMLQTFQIVGAPDWVATDRFNVQATAPGNPTQQQMQSMLRTLLEERFKLTVRDDTRELPVYGLTVARPGAPLPSKLATAAPCFSPPIGAPPAQPSPTDPAPCGFRIGGSGVTTLTARGVTMGALAVTLSTQAGRVVLDRTGLQGPFDLELQWAPNQIASPADPGAPPLPPLANDGPSLFTAVQEQLGLKLEAQRGPVKVLVIDHVEHPKED